MPAGLTRLMGLAGLGLGLAALAFWAMGGFDALEARSLAAQRGFRDSLAGAMRALRAGEGGAVWGLVGLAFGYGVLHAAGPGHGKVLIGGYGVARRVALLRLAGLALVSSLAQASVAIAVVYGGIGLFGVTRAAIGAAGDGWMIALGHMMMAAIGAWLVWRGLRGLARARGPALQSRLAGGAWHGAASVPAPSGQDHLHHSHHAGAHGHDSRHGPHPAPVPAKHPGPDDAACASQGDPHHHLPEPPHDHTPAAALRHDHRADAVCDQCGHRHAPTLTEVQAATTWRESAALVAGIAVRPCSGALMLLVLTWQLGLVWAGILGAYAMGLGTALITVGVAVLAVTAREGAFAGFPGLARARAALPLIELAAGLAIAGLALTLLFRSV